ncbi:MAG: hypothetical protein CM15mP83_2970 [Flavobacteriaceae bacterium]|nr:MAG: hypothetical protein CM15mP83_2970 [Flavobacteriaceae bacterium]
MSYPDALFEQVITKKSCKKDLTIQLGESIGRDLINEALFAYDFQRVDFVSQPGEFSVRGGIIDIFSYDKDEPYRIEFFGMMLIESIVLMSRPNCRQTLEKSILLRIWSINYKAKIASRFGPFRDSTTYFCLPSEM